MKSITLALMVLALCANAALADSVRFEGAYHSDKNANEKIIIGKVGVKKYLITNSTGKWEAQAYEGVARTDIGEIYNYYKGVISWPKKELQNVGYINMTLREDGKSIFAVHRWNFWEDAKNQDKGWNETWVKDE
ncbi:hypothetical protein [Thiocystis violascens]|uniref:hypothetical protein n=1 Tax=Thiocystis violascens TaxID=73141 RepID=UPI0012F68F5C|nr:hypothetical protein [Thiocystis violascens]